VSRRGAFRLLHAVGISVRQMRRTLLFEAAMIGAVGVVLGLVAGTLAGWVLVDGSVPALYGWRFALVLPVAAAAGLTSFTLLLAVSAGAVPARFSLHASYLKGGAQT
jgi:putative ABC transport system permease protein